MSTVGYISDQVLHAMREYSNDGDVTTIADNKDYLLSMIPAINTFQKRLATTTHKIKRIHEFSQNMPDNLLGSWNEDKVHTSEDVSYSTTGAKTYSFEADGDFTAYIEEETATDTWTINATIIGTTENGTGYVNYKGFTLVSDTDNSVRIRFTGDYRYLYRYVGLFSDSYALDANIPQYRPYVPYDLPSNFYKKDRVDATFAHQQYSNIADYRFETYEKSLKRIFIPWESKGNFAVHYYAYPTVIANASESNITENNDIELDIAEECIPLMINQIASMLMRDEDAYMSDTFNVEYYQSKAEVENESEDDIGVQDIINTSNW